MPTPLVQWESDVSAGATTVVEENPSAARRTGKPSKGVLLQRFLAAYWLRPENALWMTLRSLALRRTPFGRPSIDLGCGDGLFTFLHQGGVLDPAFDVFGSVALTAGTTADMFDFVARDYRPPIVRTPHEGLDVGADVKPSMLQKAERLRLYDRLIEHDNNRPLPFDDATFQTVYCNAAYWLRNIDGFLAELRRIVRPGGQVILQVKLEAMRRCTLAPLSGLLGGRFVEIIDGDRLACWPSLGDQQTWEHRFARAGLAVQATVPFVTTAHAQLWNVGLRPIAPLLIRMANALTPQTRASIKSDWLHLFCDLLTPLCDPTFSLSPGPCEPAEIQYVLEARK